ncbi:hypothetical protein ABUW04_12465 [Streptacidiphilus sp. N1-10]|uniref:Uncharacterized protein n=1 Tax=Streptacidiphilus jeojiensis TaxID=3229225 RepID=A0ABV6XLD9_9ACTN
MQDRAPDMPNEFLTECPPWCGGVHNPRQGWGESQFRATQPVCLDVELQGRAYEIGSVDITQYPNATDPFKREAYISLQLADPTGRTTGRPRPGGRSR